MVRKNRKVICSVSNDLVTDQRIHKVATSLLSAGYKVAVVGRKLPESQSVFRSYQVTRLTLLFRKGPMFYAELNIRLFLFLLFRHANIYLANDLDTLPANYLVSLIKRKPLVYDSHELFTQVPELINRPHIQKKWIQIERMILPRIKHSYTVSQSIADFYRKKYRIEMQVVRNVPNKVKCKEESSITNDKKIILYQGSVNIGRGVDLIIKSMKYLTEFEFWVVGNGDVLKEMKELAKLELVTGRVKFFGRVPFNELSYYTKQATVGISIEEDRGLNYRFALPNKLFDYIHAGIPVVGSDLPEIAGIINRYKIGLVLSDRVPENVAKKLQLMVQQKSQYQEWKRNLKIAANELNWENEEINLLAIFNSIKF